MTKHFDVAIIGSGFSGSILACVLASRGRQVALIDPVSHPRFAIGESSTPIADLLLRRLGETYGLKPLEQLSTYGSWQQHHRELVCGCKRGFSYYVHPSGKPFADTPDHQRSLLVAASANDSVADTQWYRRDVDQFFFQQAIAGGVENYNGSLVDLQPGRPSELTLSDHESINADWVIDASGRSSVSARLLNQESFTNQLATNTRSVFAHFRGVDSWQQVLSALGENCEADPFHTDDAAQHHLLRDGWLWVLRFNNGIASVGWTTTGDPENCPIAMLANAGRDTNEYQSIDQMLGNAELVDPSGGPTTTDRLQQLFDPVAADQCVMLPTAACTIDPLHSTGIAHALGGVGRVAQIVLGGSSIQEYRESVLSEARLLDRLVSTAYQTAADFPRFTAACMLYFAAAITCEERILAGDTPSQLWNADDGRFVETVESCCRELIENGSTQAAVEFVRRKIQPWNTAGLMDPAVNNRYAYTATK